MIVVGLTGGIGSGKTTVANFFKTLGVPVYIADDEAKKLMNSSKVIKKELVAIFGSKAYLDGLLNRDYLANKIFTDQSLLQKMNKIVHPQVAKHFKEWLKKQNSDYVIKEAAIIFEHQKQAEYDRIITVVATKEARMKRLLKRDGSSRARIEAIMANQMPDSDKIKRSHFVIENNLLEATEKQVLETHNSILESLKI
ncbi:dephospho-CoA kinase [Subsaximicrobium wynnwilliamsii]|uniref:Dephospho-CoA kinase n=1 Tax=Subsaximicrobium wynnwilliamsii TaxID=291179 RepID=A0A5C6ZP05_9FLAO|nr:dephospho-CoA kinase [Subsaximicrobium wynnwilliamsii]TXD85154.1 dephospho-CoA kinase [Subsaximicrobium wynnwilliamsii]TXD91197.1 dephospho-CoA kinase [Subsaximicrobium wynnwilliamsii]TXE04591.1 dephospho-CoA kinase [Subsaximicrobium wynnwilliamsii]